MTGKVVSIDTLAEMVNGRVIGDGKKLITAFNSVDNAAADEITFLAKAKNIEMLVNCMAGAVIVPEEVSEEKLETAIIVRNPYLAVAIIHSYFVELPFEAKGVHPRAYVEASCTLGKEITIAPLAVLGERVSIGERVLIESGAVIGDDVVIGDDTTIKANVTVYKQCKIGKRVIIHSGSIIGADGYGYAANERGEHIKRPQVGIVQIDDDVEIGANTCVDRAAYGVTLLKSGVKVDNLVQIAHNVIVGENSLLVSQVGIAGSTTLGRNVVLGGQTAVAGHIEIGDRTMVAARGGVHSNAPAGAVLGGAPAIPARKWAKCCAIYNNLPELNDKVRKNTRAIKTLLAEQKTED